MLMSHLVIDHFDLRLRLGRRRSHLQPAHNKITARIPDLQLLIRECQGLPNIGASAELATGSEVEQLKRKIEGFRHDADNREALAIEEEFRSNNLWIAIELLPPETLADDDNIITARLAFLGFEKASLHRCDPKQWKYSGSDERARDALRLIALRQVEISVTKCAQSLEALRAAVVINKLRR